MHSQVLVDALCIAHETAVQRLPLLQAWRAMRAVSFWASLALAFLLTYILLLEWFRRLPPPPCLGSAPSICHCAHGCAPDALPYAMHAALCRTVLDALAAGRFTVPGALLSNGTGGALTAYSLALVGNASLDAGACVASPP